MGARQATQGEQPVYVFGAFRLVRQARQLCLGAAPVRLGGRALELLFVLVERAGEVVSRAELERLIWPNSIVEDSCLRVHIGALRKALGEGAGEARYIANVPGRGYSFVAPVNVVRAAATPTPAPAAGARTLPLRMTSVLGRDEVLRQLREQLPRCRLATVVGHGGIGKTTVALCLASALQDAYPDGACFVDLALLSNGIQIPDALGASLGLELAGEGARAALERWLAPRRLLLVLDNCEHLIEDATALVERVLRIAPGIDIVATSREPLDAEGECVHRLAPLACPPADPALTLEEAMRYPALQLLASRARASMDTFQLGQAELPAAIALCRRVDGVPLAIEFAAARIGLLGLHGVLEQLDDRLRLLGSGRRTVLPRHRTLRALLDWSHDLLSPAEQRVLRCCAVFAGPFALESAVAVAGGAGVARSVLALVSKSLLSADTRGPDARFVLLGITRAYAIDKLAEDPERAQVAQRHARHTAALVEQCEQAWEGIDAVSWLACASDLVGNLRAALDWAFGPEGDPALGVRLAASPTALASSLFGEPELARHAGAALAAIRAGAESDPLDEARLQAMLAGAALLGNGARPGQAPDWAPFERALLQAEQGGRPAALAEALYHTARRCNGAGLYRLGHGHAQHMARVAERAGLARVLPVAWRVQVHSLHMLGVHGAAASLAQQVLDARAGKAPLRLAGPVGPTVSMRMLLARSHWLQGRGSEALALARDTLALGRDGAPVALAWALALGALPVALWHGADDWAHELAGDLGAHAERHALTYWSAWAQLYRQVLVARASQANDMSCAAWHVDAKQGDHLATFWTGLAGEQARQRCDDGQVGWCAAEVWRASGEQLLAGEPGAAGGARAAEALFLRALSLARQQGARAWELRCATSLARLWQGPGDGGRAAALLEPLVHSLGSTHDGADLRAARALLERP